MEKEKRLEDIILNESDNLIYVSDMETYELEYLNRALKEALGISAEDESYKGKRCYQVLQNNDRPCEFCTNAVLKLKKFYCGDVFNPRLNGYFHIKDKLISYCGKDMRLEVAVVQNEDLRKRKKLEAQLIVEKTLVECIRTLYEHEESQNAIDRLLHILADFYEGERAYLFEIDYEKQTASNTYEWCKRGVSAELENLQNVPLHHMKEWLIKYKEDGEFYLDSLEIEQMPDEIARQILAKQHIRNLVSAPLISNGEIKGFIGVDNPQKYISDLFLLKAVTYFIVDDLEKRRTTKMLEDLSYRDSMTGLYNRNRYNEKLQGLSEQKLQALGIIYMDINGLKEVNDELGHECGDLLIQNGARLMREAFGELTYRIGGDEFVSFLINCEEEEFDGKIKELREKIEADEAFNASVGGCFQKEPADITEQMRAADRQMYKEKERYYKVRNRRRNNAEQ